MYQIKLMKLIGDVSYEIGRLEALVAHYSLMKPETVVKVLKEIHVNLSVAVDNATENK